MPEVSVVIPCYNQGSYIHDALESVWSQTYPDYEIIVINDGSTEPETNAILKELSGPKLRVIHTENQGLAEARNTGIREATGRYILPLDADDRIGRRYMELAVELLDSDPDLGIVYCLAEKFGEDEGPWILKEFSIKQMMDHNVIFCTSFFRRVDWESVGGFKRDMKYGLEDYDFWLSILGLGRKVKRIDEVLFFYRIRTGSMVRSMTPLQLRYLFGRTYERNQLFFLSHPKETAALLKEKRINEICPSSISILFCFDSQGGFQYFDKPIENTGEPFVIAYSFSQPIECARLRWDPVSNIFSRVRVDSILITFTSGKRVMLHQTDLLHNGKLLAETGYVQFLTLDPQFEINESGEVNSVEIRGQWEHIPLEAVAPMLDAVVNPWYGRTTSILYWSSDQTFSEDRAIRKPVRLDGKGGFLFRFTPGAGTRFLRWDPVSGILCRVKLVNVAVTDDSGAVRSIPVDQISHNGTSRTEDGWVDFWTAFPQFYFHFDGVIVAVEIRGEWAPLRSSEREHLYVVLRRLSTAVDRYLRLTGNSRFGRFLRFLRRSLIGR
ncbi:glycosyl transferase family 2 [Leptonema illini DSM 21528]|uniref:Glycosyl transferase family 2 n=2 Tax=Leptonema illini TaxID=183 RepID=H2CD51_9LEPT|nr:glycosyl transferase family 2 [Leptonema illini DSM 21528]